MKRIELARYGGLSPVKQKHYTTNYDEMTFHGAPEKYGMYAFLWPYIDWFLLTGNTGKMKDDSKEYKNKRESLNCSYKRFSVDGEIWIHLDVPAKYQYMILDERGSWIKIHSDNFVLLFKKVYAITTGEAIELERNGFGSSEINDLDKTIKSAFKFFTTDHLEIFVPKGTKII